MLIKRTRTIKVLEPSLVSLLKDAVDSEASLGFMPPMYQDDALEYWQAVDEELSNNSRILLVALEEDVLIGAVQLSLNRKPNGRHRAEVEKLMVHTQARGRGVASKLMSELEKIAIGQGRKLLVLDTREGDMAEGLYRKLGYTQAGVIPDFALNANGQLNATVLFYKQLVQ